MIEADTAWMLKAACQDAPSLDLFFPVRGQTVAESLVLRYCKVCPVRPECVHYAVKTQQRHGVWGGVSFERLRRRDKQRLLEEVMSD